MDGTVQNTPAPKTMEEYRKLARAYTPLAIEILVAIASGDTKKLGVRLVTVRDRLAAAESLLDRGWGKAAQMLASDPENPIAIKVDIL